MRSVFEKFSTYHGVIRRTQSLRQSTVLWSGGRRSGDNWAVMGRRRFLSSSTYDVENRTRGDLCENSFHGVEGHADVGPNLPVERRAFSFSALTSAKARRGVERIAKLRRNRLVLYRNASIKPEGAYGNA